MMKGGHPGIDLARWWVGDWWREGPHPLNLGEWLPGEGPLRLEIGYGGGEFLMDQLAEDPTGRWLAIDIQADCHRRLCKQLNFRGWQERVLPMVGDAWVILENIIEDAVLQRIVVNFPDPWPKKRHHQRRLLQRDFFKLVTRKLVAGGELAMATDHQDYAESITEEIQETGISLREHGRQSPHAAPTRYEARWLKMGLIPHYYVYEKEKGEPSCLTST